MIIKKVDKYHNLAVFTKKILIFKHSDLVTDIKL